MKKILSLLIMFIPLAVFSIQTNESIQITKVTDGDTVKGIVNGKEISIRLSGIDCYETSKRDRCYKQAYLNKMTVEDVIVKGKASKQILTDLLKSSNDITVQFTDIDTRYNRHVGIIYAGSLNVNKYMIDSGGCTDFEYKH